MERFSENFDDKVVTYLIFSFERTDFKNVIFEKIPWAHSEKTPRSPRSNDLETQNDKNSKWKLIKNRWNPKFGLRDLENGLLTSRTSEGAQWIFPKNTFFKSGQSTEKNEL